MRILYITDDGNNYIPPALSRAFNTEVIRTNPYDYAQHLINPETMPDVAFLDFSKCMDQRASRRTTEELALKFFPAFALNCDQAQAIHTKSHGIRPIQNQDIPKALESCRFDF